MSTKVFLFLSQKCFPFIYHVEFKDSLLAKILFLHVAQAVEAGEESKDEGAGDDEVLIS